MTIAAKLNRLALCGTLAWLSLGPAGPLSAEDGWAPLHIATGPMANDAPPPRQQTPRMPNTSPGVRTVAYDSELPAVPRAASELVGDAQPTAELLPAFAPPLAAPEQIGKSCHCDRCAGASPRRVPARKHAVHPPSARTSDCLVYNVLDGVAGGIEHALRLKTPQQRGGKPMYTKPVSRMHPRRPSRGSTSIPMPPPVPMEVVPLEVETPLADPPAGPLSHPIEDLEPKTVPRLPAPIVPDELADPFEDDQAWRPGTNPTIKRSAYFE